MAIPNMSTEALVTRIRELLVCPECHGPLTVENDAIKCAASDFTGSIRDGVVILLEETFSSFFDDKFAIMQRGHEDQGEWDLFYAEQTRLLEGYLKPGALVVDVGCGPSLSYRKNGAFVVGLEPSFPSIQNNRDVDLGIMGSAAKMPFGNRTVDMIICFYSVHHMVGDSIRETRDLVTSAFREFVRVIKPGGSLFVYEVIPMAAAAVVQSLAWNPVRRLMRKKLDMHFWTAGFFDELRSDLMPDSVLEKVSFQSSPNTVFRPVFSLPQLKIYRFMYPLAPKLFKFLF